MTAVTTRVALVVLAAGRGSRFRGERHKLEQTLGESNVLGNTLRHAIASDLPVLVVTTQALMPIACSHVAARDVVVLPEAGSSDATGMGHSIAAGVAARPDASGWLILPGDMPMVQPATLRAVGAALAHHPVAYAQHAGRRGHPVGFASELYSELVMLRGDEGARRLVARYPSYGVDVNDPGALIDIDTVEDLSLLRSVRGGAKSRASVA